MKRLQINLTDAERQRLHRAVLTHPKPYLRERAHAILLIASGQSCLQVARSKLLLRRRPDTVRQWCHRYKTLGFEGLLIKSGRGRKPRFSPL